jgi:Thioesterase-like superfamily
MPGAPHVNSAQPSNPLKSPAVTTQPFFRREGDRFIPTDICRGPWDPESLHGRVLAGLLARDVERHHLPEGFHPARLTVDLYRMPPFAPVEVQSRVVRDGRRIRIVDSEFTSGGVSIGRSSCLLLRRTADPDGNVWSPPPWDAPAPDAIPSVEGEAGRMWETRIIDHGFGAVVQKNAWVRENRDFIEGEALSPFLRAAVSADYTNPFANSGDQGLQFVNADITLYLHRLPVGEWVGYQVTAHHHSEGVAVGECVMYDTEGAIGRSTVCGVANQRKP